MSKLTKLFIGFFVLLFFVLVYLLIKYFSVSGLFPFFETDQNSQNITASFKPPLDSDGKIVPSLQVSGRLICIDGYSDDGCVFSIEEESGKIFFLGNISDESFNGVEIGTRIYVEGAVTNDLKTAYPLMLVSKLEIMNE